MAASVAPQKVTPLKENVAPSHSLRSLGPGEFAVHITKTVDKPRVGLDVDHKDATTLEVTLVKEGLVKEYNETVDPKVQICPGDRIISVNGVKGDNQAMVATVMKEAKLLFIILREG